MASVNPAACGICILCFFWVMAILILAASSWMVDIDNSGTWRDIYAEIAESKAGSIGKTYQRVWSQRPFIDIVGQS